MRSGPLVISTLAHLSILGIATGLIDVIDRPYATLWVDVSGIPSKSSLPQGSPKKPARPTQKRITDQISRSQSQTIAAPIEAAGGVETGGDPVPTPGFRVTSMPELVSEVRVPYPPSAKAKGIAGPVLLDLLIDSAGRVRKAALIEGPDPELNTSALQAIREFKFRPATMDGQAVAVRIRYTYRFVLAN